MAGLDQLGAEGTMKTFFLIAAILNAILFLFCCFILYRNEWVYKQRRRCLHETFDYHQLLPYGRMLWKFWVWDVNKLKTNK